MRGGDLPRARRRGGLVAAALLVLGLAAAAAGWWGRSQHVGVADVSQIEIRTKPGLSGQAAEAKALFDFDTPDLYLLVRTPAGELRTDVEKDTPVGGGLRWTLPRRVPLGEVERIEVWEDDPLNDDLLDQRSPTGETDMARRVGEGQRFKFLLIGRHPVEPAWATPTLLAGGALALLAAGKLVWDQAV